MRLRIPDYRRKGAGQNPCEGEKTLSKCKSRSDTWGRRFRISDETGIYRQGIFKVKAVDTTAAGDTFTGYFISSIIDGMPVQDRLKLAAKASAIAVSRAGATASIPVRSEVVEK